MSEGPTVLGFSADRVVEPILVETFREIGLPQPSNPGPEPIQITKRHLSILPAAVENVRFRAGDTPAKAPHLLRVLLSTVLATKCRSPICIILPSMEQITEALALLAAVECLAVDLPETRKSFVQGLTRGTKVRLYPGGEVFEIAGVEPDGSLRLLMMDKATYKSNGTRYVTPERAYWFEPTTRQHPLGTQFTKFNQPALNELDVIVGSQIFGNAALVRTRILLAGVRTEFERALASIPITSREAAYVPAFRHFFQFGGIDASGEPYVTEPSGSAGYPMVAIGRDLLDLERACLHQESEPGSRVVLTDRIDTVLRDLDLAGRIAERQRLILVADARRRFDVEPLSHKGWTVWEPAPHEIIGRNAREIRIGCVGIDKSVRAAAAELQRSPAFISCNAQHLKSADSALASLGGFLGDESVEHEPWVDDLLKTARNLFFASAGWLTMPEGAALEIASACAERVRQSAGRVESYLGLDTALATIELADALDGFRKSIIPGGLTPKGAQISRLAKTASETSFKQMFVAGNRQSREEADAFFRSQGIPTRCLAVGELSEVPDVASVVGFSMMRQDLFERLVDPWPSSSTIFVGYDFEIICYRRRLARRHLARTRLRLNEESRATLTGFCKDSFADCQTHDSGPFRKADEIHLAGFDRATKEWNWIRRITVPAPRLGEDTCDAHIVRFSGCSWSAMTEEHGVWRITPDAKGGPSVQSGQVADLRPGTRIVVREGGDRDVIRMLAEHIKGVPNYTKLRDKAALWRRVLIEARVDSTAVRQRLEAVGVRRNPATIRAWLTYEGLIGPRSQEDLQAIAEAFPNRRVTTADWQACFDAIRETRALHLSAGAHLTGLLAARCGKMLLEPSDTELAVDLGVGTAWVLEVASVEENTRKCPSSYVNRLQWQDADWKLALLASQLREQAA